MGQAKRKREVESRRADSELHRLLDAAEGAPTAVERLQAVRDLRRRLDEVEALAWLDARHTEDCSWLDLATALGMGRSGAQRRYEQLVARL